MTQKNSPTRSTKSSRSSTRPPRGPRIGILGFGEVGQAIAQLYKWVLVKDLKRNDFISGFAGKPRTVDVLHVCLPWSKSFKLTVVKMIRQHAKGGLVIIHSTIPPGTTKQIQDSVTEGVALVVHSPVRGLHPNLLEGVKTFVKYVGADGPTGARVAAEHFQSLGITVEAEFKSKTTEVMKLLDTTYYGLCIAFHDYARRLCDQERLNFDVVMTKANTSYNKGYKKLKKSNVVRPVLFAPKGSVIGGHCVIPNAKILRDTFGTDPLLEAILRHEGPSVVP